MSEDWSVQGFKPEIIEAGEYPATVVTLKKRPGSFGDDYAQWIFQPDGLSEEAQVAGRNSKGMEWARRIVGKSGATDMKWGKDLKEKRPVVDWGPQELEGKPCRIIVEKNWDEEEERHRNRVVNVLPPDETNVEKAAAAEEQEDFSAIPF